MNRQQFVASLLLAGAPFSAFSTASETDDLVSPIAPPVLKPGDRIAITSPAGYISAIDILPAVEQLQSWGLEVVTGSSVGKRDFTFGGTDDERRHDFQQLINDPAVKAILCARGGYGVVRIIDRIDFSALAEHPKWIIGFSDITVLHCHLNRNYGLASLHSKMCNSFPTNWNEADAVQKETILSIRNALMGKPVEYTTPPSSFNRTGIAEGVLVGGNLKTIESLAGSKSDLRTTNKILFVEDTGEYLYSIDRMFWNLKRSGKLDHLAGLIIGGFKTKPAEDPADEFGKTLEQIVLEKLEGCNYPVCFNFPVGHQKNNYALKCGVMHKLTVTSTEVRLSEKNKPRH
jgi:muramoyltetrapeptide carboxypeptidase